MVVPRYGSYRGTNRVAQMISSTASSDSEKEIVAELDRLHAKAQRLPEHRRLADALHHIVQAKQAVLDAEYDRQQFSKRFDGQTSSDYPGIV